MARISQTTESIVAAQTGIGREVVKLLGTLCFLSALGYFFWIGGNFTQRARDPAILGEFKPTSRELQDLCGSDSFRGPAVAIEMVYSPERGIPFALVVACCGGEGRT